MILPDSAARYADMGGFPLVAARMVEKGIFDSPLNVLPLQSAYWSVAPRYYRYLSTEVDNYPRDVDPFQIAWVDPSAITRFTKREYPFWVDIKHQFGTVRDGDWDIRNETPIDRTYDGTPPKLYLADRFEETVLHQSLQERFSNGTPWDETEFVEIAQQIVAEGGTVWNHCRTEAEIATACNHVDQLYESMQQRGCLPYRHVLKEQDALQIDFLQCLKGEIVVDIGRDGNLLFVDGRHRLSIAKLLGLERVPIIVLVRHEQWMRSQDPGVTGQIPGHPDHPGDLTDQ